MANIIQDANTVREAVDQIAEQLLGGLFRERPGMRKHESERNKAARRAVELFREELGRAYCPDADTLLGDVPLPLFWSKSDEE